MENKGIKLELRNISKHFKGVYANKNVNINQKNRHTIIEEQRKERYYEIH